MDIIYKCIVGSTLHGLRTTTSDTDIRFVYMDKLINILSPFKGFRVKVDAAEETEGWSLVHFCKLCAKGNPTGLEVLWSPLNATSEVFDLLSMNKKAFLCSDLIRESHIGYAESQIWRYLRRPEKDPNCWDDANWVKRIPKATVAAYRVLEQGRDLLYNKTFDTTVDEKLKGFLMDIKLTNPSSIDNEWLQEHCAKINEKIVIIKGIKSEYNQNLPLIENLLLRIYTDKSLSMELHVSCEEMKDEIKDDNSTGQGP